MKLQQIVDVVKKLFPQYRPYIIAFLIVGVFHSALLKVYESTIIKPFLSNIKVDAFLWISIGFLLLGLIALSIYVRIKRVKISFDLTATISFITLIYLISRFGNDSTYLDLIGPFKVADICFLPFLMVVVSLLPTSKVLINDTNSGYLTDEPLDNPADDYRSELATQVAYKILHTKNSKTSFAFGVVGAWGSGKSTFLKQLESIFNDPKNNCEIIKFNPWQVEDSKSITKEFFNTLSNRLNQLLVGFRITIDDYASNLIGQGKDNYLRLLLSKTVFLFRNETKTLAEKHDDIQKGIKDIGKKIIVLIDDLDRLQKDEVIEVLKLIRNAANFGNLTFIVAFDQLYVDKCLDNPDSEMSGKYLDKIFQGSVMMNSFRSEHLRKDLLKKLTSILDKADMDYLVQSSDNFQFELFENGLKGYRNVNRFVNLTTTYYPLFKNKVFFPDFYRILFIKLSYPLAYRIIYLKWSEFFTIHNDQLKAEQIKKYYELVLKRKDNDNGSNSHNTSLLRNHLIETGYNETDALNIETKILALFSPINESRYRSDDQKLGIEDKSHLSIRFSKNLPTYFDLDNTTLSHDEFCKAFENGEEELEKCVKDWFEKGWGLDYDFRIKNHKTYKDHVEFKKVLITIIAASELKITTPFDYIYYNREILNRIHLDGYTLLSKIFPSKEAYSLCAIEIFERKKHCNIVLETSIYMLREEEFIPTGNHEVSIVNKLFAIVIAHFIKHVNCTDKLDSMTFDSLRVIADITRKYINKVILTADYDLLIKTIRDKIIVNSIDEFIMKVLLRDETNPDQFFLYERIIKLLFKDNKEMILFLESHSSKSKYLNEFKEFIKYQALSTKTVNFLYQFKTIPTSNLLPISQIN